MGNASTGKFAIGRLKQSDKDTPNVSEMVRYPFIYGAGFEIATAVDNYSDLVESQFESSRTDILSTATSGAVPMAISSDIMALMLASMLGTVNTTALGASYEHAFTAATTDICTATAHGFRKGQKVTVSTTDTLPAGLAASTVYYVGSVTADTFKLYATFAAADTGGTAVDITDTGTGTHTVTPEIYQHVITPASSETPNFHTILFDDGTCDRRVVGAVPTSFGFSCDSLRNARMNGAAEFTAIRREWNDATPTAAFTAATTDICTSAAHGLRDGEAVRLTTTDTLPAGLSLATTYYVQKIDTNTFYLHTSFQGAANQTSSTRVDITDTGTGTHTFTAYQVSYPTQEQITPFHFTKGGAVLNITVGTGSETAYATNWAGFSYSLANAIAAEQRAGSNTVRVIEKVDRVQSLSLILDYSDATFKDIIQGYQTAVSPDQIQITVTLEGRPIGSGVNHKMTAEFYNVNLGNHTYNADPSIGKQVLSLSVNHDTGEGKSVQWTIINDVDGYLS